MALAPPKQTRCCCRSTVLPSAVLLAASFLSRRLNVHCRHGMLPGRPQLFIHVEKLKATQKAAEIFMAINKSVADKCVKKHAKQNRNNVRIRISRCLQVVAKHVELRSFIPKKTHVSKRLGYSCNLVCDVIASTECPCLPRRCCIFDGSCTDHVPKVNVVSALRASYAINRRHCATASDPMIPQ